ncbi:hypothetical protein KDK_15900 [Dictyobacter kobayashii]|uniref:Uncharacterized protein n=1 Tax=Dictyobacter kobayashii TaxID=2014872 RepID=A0A402AF94_9CHLR|nr:hypothetical protein KDK_15900 [Dictyobacter kobayashii]
MFVHLVVLYAVIMAAYRLIDYYQRKVHEVSDSIALMKGFSHGRYAQAFIYLSGVIGPLPATTMATCLLDGAAAVS